VRAAHASASRTVSGALATLLARRRSSAKRESEWGAGTTRTEGGDSAGATCSAWLKRTTRHLPAASSK